MHLLLSLKRILPVQAVGPCLLVLLLAAVMPMPTLAGWSLGSGRRALQEPAPAPLPAEGQSIQVTTADGVPVEVGAATTPKDLSLPTQASAHCSRAAEPVRAACTAPTAVPCSPLQTSACAVNNNSSSNCCCSNPLESYLTSAHSLVPPPGLRHAGNRCHHH